MQLGTSGCFIPFNSIGYSRRLLKQMNFFHHLLSRLNRLFVPGIVLLTSLTVSSPAQTLHFAYTANLNCNLEACNCGNENLGGMVRLATVVDSLRKKYPDLILVDSGDFLNTYLLTKADSLMWYFMAKVNFDAVGVGDQEYVEGSSFLLAQQKQFPLPLVNCNILTAETERSAFARYKIIRRENVKIGIVAVIFPESFEFILEKSIRILPAVESLGKLVPELKAKTDLLILLCHGGFDKTRAVAQAFPEIPVLLAGHSQEKREAILPGQVVVQPGVDGEYLGFLVIENKAGRWSFRNHFIPVNPVFPENRDFRLKVDEYYRQLKEGK